MNLTNLNELRNEFQKRGYYEFINTNPTVIDILYELDLLPEQCNSVEKFQRMFRLVIMLDVFKNASK